MEGMVAVAGKAGRPHQLKITIVAGQTQNKRRPLQHPVYMKKRGTCINKYPQLNDVDSLLYNHSPIFTFRSIPTFWQTFNMFLVLLDCVSLRCFPLSAVVEQLLY